jgi:3-hydroxybutyryl-CoA dehydrogenase
MTEIRTVGVLGGGLMGSGIAQLCALSGYDTIVREVSSAMCAKAQASIQASLDKAIERGKATVEDKEGALARLRFHDNVADLRECDIIIEAVVEERDVKRALFGDLDALCPPHTIFASNTSSLTIAELAGATKRPDKFVGLHFFNPAPVMQLVEVVRAIQTSAETCDRAFAFVQSLGKEPIRAKDRSGFVVNLLLVPYMLDAVRALESGFASMTDIDTGMRLGAGHPMGPFTLLDFVGLDTVCKISEIMFDEYHERRYSAPPLLKRMVMAGMLGKKSGMGFYNYSKNPPIPNDLGL